MQTLFQTIDPILPDPSVIEQAAGIIQTGGLVAFPTETVYGLGADAYCKSAVRRVYEVKGRPPDNPLIAHIASMDKLYEVVRKIPDYAMVLIDRFWPGPLTIVLPKNDGFPAWATAGLSTVAIRFSEHAAACALLMAADTVICAPSANLSGRPSPTTAAHVRDDLDGRVEMILDGGSVTMGLESTVVDATGDKPVVLRPGFITAEMLSSAVGRVEPYQTVRGDLPKSPGMKYKHYAPCAAMTLVTGDLNNVIREIKRLANLSANSKNKIGILASSQSLSVYDHDFATVFSYGDRTNPQAVGRELFAALRKFDDHGIEIIFAEGIAETDVGTAVMNRLKKASDRVIEV